MATKTTSKIITAFNTSAISILTLAVVFAVAVVLIVIGLFGYWRWNEHKQINNYWQQFNKISQSSNFKTVFESQSSPVVSRSLDCGDGCQISAVFSSNLSFDKTVAFLVSDHLIDNLTLTDNKQSSQSRENENIRQAALTFNGSKSDDNFAVYAEISTFDVTKKTCNGPEYSLKNETLCKHEADSGKVQLILKVGSKAYH